MTEFLIKSHQYKEWNEEIPDQYKCCVCKLILIETKQTPCGCRLCNTCGQTYFNEIKPCPVGELECCQKVSSNDLATDRASDREILKLKVKCIFDQCETRDSVSNLEQHITECPYRQIQCNQCEQEIFYSSQEQHMQTQCTSRIVKCEFCNDKMSIKELELTHHNVDSQELCEFYKGICPNNCGEIRIVLLKNHLNECDNKKMNCPYGACDPIRKNELTKHLRENEHKHIVDLINKMTEWQQLADKLREHAEVQTDLLRDVQNISKTTSKTCIQLDKEYQELKAKTIIPKAPVVPVINSNRKPHRYAPYIWRIANYRERFEEARIGSITAIESEAFYTEENGYKMMMKVYPYGDGTGHQNYLSVYFVIMRSDFDSILKWPFKEKVTFTLIKAGGKEGLSQTFLSGKAAETCRRPTTEKNAGLGAPQFITHRELEKDYIIDGSVFIKLTIPD